MIIRRLDASPRSRLAGSVLLAACGSSGGDETRDHHGPDRDGERQAER